MPFEGHRMTLMGSIGKISAGLRAKLGDNLRENNACSKLKKGTRMDSLK